MEGQIVADNPGAQAIPEPAPASVMAEPAAPAPATVPPKYTMNPLLMDEPPAPAASIPPVTPEIPAVNEPLATPVPGSGPETLILGKFKTVDDLVKSYQEVEGLTSRQGNELGELRRQVEAMQARPPQEPAQPAQPVKEEPPQWTPEMDEAWREQFYADPRKAMGEMFMGMLQNVLPQALAPIAPLMESHQYTQQVNDFVGKINDFAQVNPDILEFAPEIEQVIDKFGDSVTSLPNAVEVIYSMAKGMRPTPPPAPTLEQMLADPNFINQVAQNTTVRNNILKGYATQVREGQPPVVMGSGPSGVPPAAPTEKPKSVKEATGFFRSWLNKMS